MVIMNLENKNAFLIGKKNISMSKFCCALNKRLGKTWHVFHHFYERMVTREFYLNPCMRSDFKKIYGSF